LYNQTKAEHVFERIQAVSRMGYLTQRNQDGGSVTYDEIKNIGSMDIYVVSYATGFGVTIEAEKVDKYNILGVAAQKQNVGRAIADTEDFVCADKFNNHTATTAYAQNTKGYVGVDAVAMVSHSHPTLSAANWSNRGDGTNDLAFSNLNIEKAISQMRQQKTYRDIEATMNGPFVLVVPTELEMAARRYVASGKLPQSANNDENVNVQAGITEVLCDPKLTSATAWWLVAANKEDRDLNFMRRLDLASMIADDPDTFQTKVTFNTEFTTFHAESFGIWGTTGA
jgi:hypothetical protein